MRPHPVYEGKEIRATFQPKDTKGLNGGTRIMVGHEFVWRHIGWTTDTPIWTLADQEDLDAYYTIVGKEQGQKALLILEEDLDILRVEKFDA